MADQSYSVPKKMQETYDVIVALTDAFCETHLDEEYADMCRRLAAKLSRKRPSPLARGRPKNWAGAIVYTIGRVNFLFDASQTPHVSAQELCDVMNVNQSTVSNKARDIEEMLDIGLMDPVWTLPSRIDDNPMVWRISVNGFIMDARYAPREIQEEAFRLGLIPYVPE